MERPNSTNRSLIKYNVSMKNFQNDTSSISHYFEKKSNSITRFKNPKDRLGFGLHLKREEVD